MTIKEAIETLEMCTDEECYWAIKKAIIALKEKQGRENPKPLTLKQLKHMDGKPVWVSLEDGTYGEWTIIAIGCNTGLLKAVSLNRAYEKCDYGKTWVAYAHELEVQK